MLLKKANLVRMSVAAAALTGAVTVATPAMAEVSASVAVANMYLWRGIDLGDGSAAVSGDLVYSHDSGGYGGIWVSSGDDTLGNEYDYFVGYGGEAGDFTYDLSLWNYNYSDADWNGNLNRSNDSLGDLSEIILTVGYDVFSFSYYDNVAGGSGYEYYTLSGTYEEFSATVGHHDFNAGSGGNDDMTHLTVSYAFNDNVTFTASKVVDQGCDKNDAVCGAIDEDMNFVVSYSLPIEM